jgi:predicted phage-related endonuclease
METARPSLELIAANALPKGIERLPVKSRAQWLKLRERDVTASVVAALVGEHDFHTEYGLFCLKSGKTTEEADQKKARMLRVRLAHEPTVVDLIREERPTWTLQYPVGFYFRDPAARLGASPDLFAIDPARPGFGNVQIKTSHERVFANKDHGWVKEEGVIEPPFGIAVQACVEAALTGASWAAVAVGVGIDLELHIIDDIPIHAAMMKHLRVLSLKFWKRVEENDPPPVDYVRDAETIAALHPIADEGKTVDLAGSNRARDLVETREALKRDEAIGAAAAKARKPIDAEILSILGDAAYGNLGDGRVISAKTMKRDGYFVKPTSYRQIKVKGDTNARRSNAAAEGPQSADAWSKPF